MQPTILPTIICVLGLLLNGAPAQGTMRHATKIRAGVPPYDVVADMMRANQKKMPDIVATTDVRQTPYITWLADCDPRLQPDLVLQDFHNRILNIQNPGGQLNLATEAVDFGIRELFSPVLLITGTSDSPTLQLLAGTEREMSPAIDQALAPLRQLLPKDIEKNNNDPLQTTISRAMTESNVDLQVETAMKRYGDRVANGRLVIIGSLLDFTGDYGAGKGRLIVININGETDDDALRQHPMLIKLSPEQRLAVGRMPRPAARQKRNGLRKNKNGRSYYEGNGHECVTLRS